MQPLIDWASLQNIMERGLETGKWSIAQFNRRDYRSFVPTSVSKKQVLPSYGFLKDHPQFLDMEFRDLSAYKRTNHRSAF